MGDSERGTLHVVLTKSNDNALRVSKAAEPYLNLVSQAAGKFAASIAGDATVPADPRAVAAAVTAQIQQLTPELLAAGNIALS